MKFLEFAQMEHFYLFVSSGLADVLFSSCKLSNHKQLIEIWSRLFAQKDTLGPTNAFGSSSIDLMVYFLVAFVENNLLKSKIEQRQILKQWTFSNKEQEAILWVLEKFSSRSNWMLQRMGRQVLLFENPHIWILDHLICWLAEANQIECWSEAKRSFDKIAVDAQLPAPLLNGKKLGAYFEGKKLGEILELTYLEQLEGAFSDEVQAMDWIKRFQERGEKHDA